MAHGNPTRQEIVRSIRRELESASPEVLRGDGGMEYADTKFRKKELEEILTRLRREAR